MAYEPTPVPETENIVDYVYRELLRVSSQLRMVEEGQFLKIWQAPPPKPREHMLAVAAGAPGWNPGSGKGLYEYISGSWHKL